MFKEQHISLFKNTREVCTAPKAIGKKKTLHKKIKNFLGCSIHTYKESLVLHGVENVMTPNHFL